MVRNITSEQSSTCQAATSTGSYKFYFITWSPVDSQSGLLLQRQKRRHLAPGGLCNRSAGNKNQPSAVFRFDKSQNCESL